VIGSSGEVFFRRVISQAKLSNFIGLNASPFARSGLALGRLVHLSVELKIVSLGIVVVVQLSYKVVYLYINKEREFWCSSGIMVFPVT
jgi:hypothetical protein